MPRADISAPRQTRVGVAVLVVLLHVAAVLALVRAFAPDFTRQVTDTVVSAITVTITTPPPTPPPAPAPSPSPAAASQAEGVAAPAGRQANPRAAAAPRPKVVIARAVAPPVAGAGADSASGARDRGEGTGAGGQGSGTGAGAAGSGQGGSGAATGAVKIAGEINSARDYPKATRALRIDDHVIVALTVGADGRVKACRIHRASRDAEADRITCRLAAERFRFRPALDRVGNPVESQFGWKQRWFYPRIGPSSAQEPPVIKD